MYQGHLADGSSVQNHSAGPVYPYVIGFTDAAGYYVLCPNGVEIKTVTGTYEQAHFAAEALKAAKRNLH
jgi:hypothetical protein